MAARSTLTESVAAALRHAILHGAYPSGERLVELTIAREMNVSQNTVRDALRLLEQDGLVVKRARYGTHVRTFTPEEITETYALWAAIEGLALRWALAHLTPDGIAYLRELLNQLRDRGSLESRFRFHTALVEMAGRPQTADLLNHLHNRARLLENSRPARTPSELADQAAMYDLLLDAIITENLSQAQRLLRDLLEAEGGDMAALIAEHAALSN